MPSIKFTTAGLKKLTPPPEGKQVTYFDTELRGLILRASSGGAQQFRALYYTKRANRAGKVLTVARSIALGRSDHMDLKAARDAARKFLADPKEGLKEAESRNFKELAEDFIRRHVEANDLRSAHEIKRCLAKYVYPRWQAKTMLQIRRADLTSLLDDIEDKNGARQADMVLSIVAKIMRWHQARVDDYVPPLAPGMRRYKAPTRKRILDDAEIVAVWNACGELGTYGALVKVLLLTAQRREKVAPMRRDDITDGTWLIRVEHAREKGHAGSLKLSPAALDIIDAQPIISGNPHVFPGSLQGRRNKPIKKPVGPPAFNSWSQRKKELDVLVRKSLPGMKPWRIHDLRRTARSLMSRADVRREIAERVLGHAIAGVEGVYDRYEYSKQKADALVKLAAMIDTIVRPRKANVVSITGRNKRRAT